MRLGSCVNIFLDDNALSGVKKIADKVANDFELVTGKKANVTEFSDGTLTETKGTSAGLSDSNCACIVAATLGSSKYLDKLIENGEFDANEIKDKWEVYSFKVVPAKGNEPEKLLIAGSDKRGTIYGLFHVSEILGVSPWYWFADVKPQHKDCIEISSKDNFVSKVPSVKYRGFFINDEWPAFGNWTFEHFGGFTTEMYDHVFELLLRLKGNYLWPAMWTSNFSLDGPGLSNAILADEYGVVMSNSHHEPCLRHSEEWDLVKGDDTPYGTAWNFDKNKEGLKNYWRGGLLRNGKYENIITMGMRGERDSEVLGATATLKDNIDYLKEVITVQNELIKETVSENLDDTHRMLAIYKEVEKYFHGDETTEGLKNWDGLNGITCMLCEDNFGNLRTLPEKDQRDRKGGWGMYYHFDYHGDPISYEWINSTHIARTCEQMSQAYDYGIREIWIVNVGDLKPQEFPLSYFLDLAYDIDKWGQGNPDAVRDYTNRWVDAQFPAFNDSFRKDTVKLLEGYTRLNYIRKPEALNSDIYSPIAYGEADSVLDKAGKLKKIAEKLYPDIKGSDDESAFYQLIYFPVMAAANIIEMNIFGGKNHILAVQGATLANAYAERIRACIALDRELCEKYHALNGGKWNGLTLSEHVGFIHWNEEECAYPIMMEIEPANKPRMVVTAGHRIKHTMGGDWTRKKLFMDEFLDPDTEKACIYIRNGAKTDFDYKIENIPSWLKADKVSGKVSGEASASEEAVELTIDRKALKNSGELISSAVITVRTGFAHADIEILGASFENKKEVILLPEDILIKEKMAGLQKEIIVNELGLVLEADEADSFIAGMNSEYKVIKGFGKYRSGLKAFPTTESFVPGVNAPCAEYSFDLREDSNVEIMLLTAPNNPVEKGNPMAVGISIGDGEIKKIATVENGYEGGERTSPQWVAGALDQIHTTSFELAAKKGKNTLKIYAADPGVVIERILIRQSGTSWAGGYLGKAPEWILN
ncbi:MAG: glycosyl hydrolase 115 family protein [Lachnospiraceae bacterium]|nr:glycosyl hydrolase 115 family protein [Lachnospiraceae bacterium]